MIALLFPGQGTQRVGMGHALFRGFEEALTPLAHASAAMGTDVGQLLRRGPSSMLTRTKYAQVAVTTVNLAALEILHARGVGYRVVAGHSVGAIAALAAAGVLPPAAAIRLAAHRAALMDAVPGCGTMVNVTGVPHEAVSAAASRASARTGACVVVGLVNGPQNVVISGARPAVDGAVGELRRIGAVTCRPLAVSHAFHSPLMEPAAPAWRDTVAAQPLGEARVPIIADTTGGPLVEPREIRDFLVAQLTQPVRWDKVCAQLLSMRAEQAIEAGDSTVLRSFARAYQPMRVEALSSPAVLAGLRRRTASLRPPVPPLSPIPATK